MLDMISPSLLGHFKTSTPQFYMAPKHSQIIVPVKDVQPTRHSSQATQKAAAGVIVDIPMKKVPKGSSSKQRKDEDTKIIIHKASQQLSKDLYDGPPEQILELEGYDDVDKPTDCAGPDPQSKACTEKPYHPT